MPLIAHKRGQTERLLDVRSINLGIPKKEAHSDAAFLESLSAEFAYTAETEWQSWVEDYKDHAIDGDWGICLSLACDLKIIAPERISGLIKPEHQAGMQSSLFMSFLRNDESIGKYCYLFSVSPAQIFTTGEQTSKTRILNSLRGFKARADNLVFAESVAWVNQAWPDLIPKAELETYRIYLLSLFDDTRYSAFDYLIIAASLRMLYPEHTEYLEYLEKFTVEEIKSQMVDFASDDLWYITACVKIITSPEIPGLTSRPTKTDQALQFAAKLPEQPQQLAI